MKTWAERAKMRPIWRRTNSYNDYPSGEGVKLYGTQTYDLEPVHRLQKPTTDEMHEYITHSTHCDCSSCTKCRGWNQRTEVVQ